MLRAVLPLAHSASRITWQRTSSVSRLSGQSLGFKVMTITSSDAESHGSSRSGSLRYQTTGGLQKKKRLDVAIVGAPNAGKSQFLNTIMGTTVAAVSRKRHTTRGGILAAKTVEDTQIVFVDTPGFLRTTSAKQEGLMRELMVTAASEIDDADYTIVLVDAARNMDDDLREALTTLMLRAIHARGRVEMQTLEEGEEENQFTLKHAHPQDDEDVPREKFAIVLNKVDLVNPKKKMLTLATELGVIGDNCVKYGREPPSSHEEELAKFASLSREELFAIEKQFPPVFFISALEDDGVQDILNHLLRLATPSEEWTLEADQVTQMSPVERIEEVIREKLYRSLHREVPHQIEQMNRTYRTVENKEEGSKIVHIDQDLIVRTKSHLKLVMGRGGMTLKRIETAAKRDLIKLFDCSDVILHLHVKFTKSRHARPLDGQNVGVSQQVF